MSYILTHIDESRYRVVGGTWSRVMPIRYLDENNVERRVCVKKPKDNVQLERVLVSTTRREQELLNRGVDIIAPTYSLNDNLCLQYDALYSAPTNGVSIVEAETQLHRYLQERKISLSDLMNNAIHTKHGFCIIDVLDCQLS